MSPLPVAMHVLRSIRTPGGSPGDDHIWQTGLVCDSVPMQIRWERSNCLGKKLRTGDRVLRNQTLPSVYFISSLYDFTASGNIASHKQGHSWAEMPSCLRIKSLSK